MHKLKVGVVGMGFIGASHIDAIRRIGIAELVAVADTNYELAKTKAEEYSIPRCYETMEALLADPEVAVIHNCTPNLLHLEINRKVIEAKKHIFSEKPLAMTSGDSAEMLALLSQNPEIAHAVNFNYRMNPLVQEMKNRVQAGEIGVPMLVHGTYLQDWLLLETDYNWRIEPEISGPSRCVADIGSHWMDTVQCVLGSRITQVCADMATLLPVRKKPKGQVETFSVNTSGEYEDKTVSTEDYAAVLVRFENGTRGVFCVSEMSAGHKCRLDFEVDGSKASFYWNQEQPDQMWMGMRNDYNRSIFRDPNLMTAEARPYTHLAAGHPEGWNDALYNNIRSFYTFIAEGKTPGVDRTDFATFADGHYIVKLTEAILQSANEKRWISIQ